jgi:hypothetical protein
MKKFNIILSTLIISGIFGVQAQEPIAKQVEKTKGVENIAKGFEYYDGTQSENKDEKLILKYLKEISDENKKQTKIQEDILKILKSTMDPEPKIIKKKDGTECIANSSSNCFDYASLIENNPEVRRIPAMKEFLSDPYDLSKVVEYQKWQAELFKHAFNTGNSIQLAQEEFGDKAFPLGLNRTSFNNTTGIVEANMLPEIKKKYLDEIKDKFTIDIYLGFNNNLDLMAIPGLTNIILSNPSLNYRLYFSNQTSKDIYESAMNSVYSKDGVIFNVVKTVDEKKFNENKIYTTPSIVMTYKKDAQNFVAQTINTGNVTNETFIDRVFNYLEFLKVLDYQKLSDTKYWQTDAAEKERKDFYIKRFGVGKDLEGTKNVK